MPALYFLYPGIDMRIIMFGLNHISAPVEIREKFAVSDVMSAILYRELKKYADELLILSTCNRVEYYFITDRDIGELKLKVAEITGTAMEFISNYSYTLEGKDAVKHIFEVAAGINSLVVGEPQIFGQLKKSFSNARACSVVKRYLNMLENFTIKTAKRVRTQTKIAEKAVSVSYAAVILARKIFGSLERRKALIIGAGQMCELACKYLSSSNVESIYITNRTYAKAEALAQEFGGAALNFDDFSSALSSVDIVISSVGAYEPVITEDMMINAMKERKNAPIFLIDIAVPRNISQDAGKLDNVYLYDIDDLESVVLKNGKERLNEAMKAALFIDEAVDDFFKDVDNVELIPLIKNLKNLAKIINEHELERFCRKNGVTDPKEVEKFNLLLQSASNKLLHSPLVNLKKMAKNNKEMRDIVASLFEIEA